MVKKVLIGMLAIIIGVTAIAFVLASKHALVLHPKGTIAKDELQLIITNVALMLSIILPTYLVLFAVVWKYCLKKGKKDYDLEHRPGHFGELIMWVLPSIVVVFMAIVTWEATHKLDPYKPLQSDVKPLVVQVVALNWKWLFIYPEQGIATLNYLQIPEQTPIHLQLTADHSPMNSFWIPELSGQIYAMAGMMTQLHLMADGPGEYRGRAVEINGEGYADMTFETKSSSQQDFENWVKQVKQSSNPLNEKVYNELVKPAIDKSVQLFSEVKENLYSEIINKYMYPAEPVL